MSAATQNEMERLRAERDSAIEQVAYWRERAVAAEGREQALAARYAALADEVRAMIHDSDGLAGYHLNGEVACWSEFEVGHLLSEPEDLGEKVLARLKAQWQADAMEGWLLQMRYMEGLNTHDCMDSAEVYAEELRRQAEGGE